MRNGHVATFALSLFLAACSGTQEPVTTTASAAPQAPSPGPRADDGFDDRGLALAQHDLMGRTGDDAARAELRLTVAQTRAFILAVVHALPPVGGAAAPASAAPGAEGSSEAPSSAPGGPRFDPPATLVQQLGATNECSNGGVAHACAARLGNTLLARIDSLHPPADLANVKYALLATMAALEESRVVIGTDVRWNILQNGEDSAAHLAQALTLLLAARHVAQAIAANCPCEEVAHIAARLADDLAIGTCSDAYETLLGRDGNGVDSHAGLTALANAGCIPTCARASASAAGDDAIPNAAHACRAETGEVFFAPFADANRSLSEWMRATRTRLEAVGDDPAVRDVLAARPVVPPTAELPMPPPLFRAGGNASIEVPAVPGAPGEALTMAAAGALAWVGPSGDVAVSPARHFSIEPVADAATRTGAIESLASLVNDAAGAPAAGTQRAPIAFVLDPTTLAPRVLAAITHASAGEAHGGDDIVGFAVRHGIESGYVPARVVATAPARVYRLGEHQIVVMDHDRGTNVVALAAPPADGADLLGGAVPDAAPTDAFAVALEPDVSGATLARVLNALAIHGARAATPQVPGLVSTLAESPVLQGTIDEAHGRALTTALETHRAEATHCMESVTGEGAGLPRVDLHLTLDPRGRITHAETATDGARSSAAAECITRATRRWRLPAPAVATEVRYAFVRAPAP